MVIIILWNVILVIAYCDKQGWLKHTSSCSLSTSNSSSLTVNPHLFIWTLNLPGGIADNCTVFDIAVRS